MFKPSDDANNIKGKDDKPSKKKPGKGKKKSANPFANVVKDSK